MDPLDHQPVEQGLNYLKTIAKYFADNWEKPTSKVNLKVLFKRLGTSIQEQEESLHETKRYCKSIEGMMKNDSLIPVETLENTMGLLGKIKQEVIERVIFLRNRKECIEKELQLLVHRR